MSVLHFCCNQICFFSCGIPEVINYEKNLPDNPQISCCLLVCLALQSLSMIDLIHVLLMVINFSSTDFQTKDTQNTLSYKVEPL